MICVRTDGDHTAFEVTSGLLKNDRCVANDSGNSFLMDTGVENRQNGAITHFDADAQVDGIRMIAIETHS